MGIGSLIDWARRPPSAWQEVLAERLVRREHPADAMATVHACADWLARAQDHSTSADGGVARHFSFETGWSPSYPETTGYIVPTLLACATHLKRPELHARAVRMAEWLKSVQFAEGGFPGGMITEKPQVPVTFNTGQILLGLVAMLKVDAPRYQQSVERAADWLMNTMDEDGCWRRFATPFAEAGEKAYETHVAWGLFSAAKACGREDWLQAAVKNVDWAISKQTANGWVRDCCLGSPDRPLTHTLGYFMKGVVEAYRYSGQQRFLEAAVRTADGLLSARRADGALPAQLDAKWRAAVSFVCLTGCSQIAQSWFDLQVLTGKNAYRDAALTLNRFVRRTITTAAARPDVAGGVKGSFPVAGTYGRFQLLNWASKFTIDANLQELALDPDVYLSGPARY